MEVLHLNMWNARDSDTREGEMSLSASRPAMLTILFVRALGVKTDILEQLLI
jgi:hypothetical protein